MFSRRAPAQRRRFPLMDFACQWSANARNHRAIYSRYHNTHMARENSPPVTHITNPLLGRCDVIGRGRMGQALTTALTRAGVQVNGPLARGADGDGAAIVLLCVPDREIAAASAVIQSRAIVGHVSASAPLDV